MKFHSKSARKVKLPKVRVLITNQIRKNCHSTIQLGFAAMAILYKDFCWMAKIVSQRNLGERNVIILKICKLNHF